MGCFESLEGTPEKEIRAVEHVLRFNVYSVGDLVSAFWNKNEGKYISIEQVQSALVDLHWYETKKVDINAARSEFDNLQESIKLSDDEGLTKLGLTAL